MKKVFLTILIIAMISGAIMPLSAKIVVESNTTTIKDGGYISGVFKAVEDDWSCVITLKSDGSFTMVEREGGDVEPTVYGTYSLSDNIYRGETVYIYLYRNGSKIGQGTLAWPLEGGLCILIDGAIFYKQ